jgi:hypothetical protein
MIFSELYSAYYNTVAKIIQEIIGGGVDNEAVHKIIGEYAFEESVLNILPAIKGERWQVITKKYKTPIKHIPTMPLTTLQKRWLKAILMDERIRLFDIQIEGLEDVEPLFTQDDYRIYDKYLDGDDYQDEEYIKRFKVILYAIRNKLPIKAEMINRKGSKVYTKFVPQRLEYSEKDDKFRVLGSGSRFIATINIARLTKCSLYEGNYEDRPSLRVSRRSAITMMVKDERNALERTMLHFAHFEKQVEKVDDKNYKVVIQYDGDDEPEMVIRVLAFGPLVEVVEPQDFRELIINKLKKQQNCGLK